MLNSKGFDLWADGYDRDVGLSDEDTLYPFAGYKTVLGRIFDTVMKKSAPAVLDIGFGTAVLTSKLYERGCRVFGQDFSPRMVEIASEKMPEARLYCGNNKLAAINVSYCPELATFSCYGNQLTYLDVSINIALTDLNCSPMKDLDGNNLLATLYVSQGQEIPNVTVNRSNLYIPDETQILINPDNGGN